jgi:hypothetical protein
MTTDEFVALWNNKPLEVAGSTAKDQCVDLANGYIRDVLGLPIIEWTNARDFPSKVSPLDYDYIVNTPTGIPSKGDLVIWGGSIYGHIAVFLEGDANTFTSFDQNWPEYSPCHKQFHKSYLNVLGWLHPKKDNMLIYKEFDLSNTESMKSLVDFWVEYVKEGKLNQLRAELKASNQANEENDLLTSKLVTDLDNATKKVSTLEAQVTVLETSKSELTDRINKQSEILAQQNNDIQKLQIQLAAIPQNETMTPTWPNLVAMFRLVLKGWLSK